MCEIVGYSKEELLGMNFLEITHPEDREEDLERFRRIISGDSTECEKRYVRKDGSVVWASVKARVIRDEVGRPLRTVAVIQDITARKRIEKRQYLLAQASRSFAEVGTEYQRLLDAIARTVAENLGDNCGVWLVSEDGQWLEPLAFHHPVPETLALIREMVSDPLRVGEGVTGKVAQTGQSFIAPVIPPEQSYAMMKPKYRPYLDRVGVHSLVVVPLRARGRVLGTLAAGRDRPGRPYTEEDRELLEDLGDRAALAIDNARLYEEAEKDIAERNKAEEELRGTLRELADMKFAIDESAIVAFNDQRGRITYVNDKFCEIAKYDREELLDEVLRIINS